MNSTWAALAEVILVFGGVLLFGWWQLRSIKKDQAHSTRRAIESAHPSPAGPHAGPTSSNPPGESEGEHTGPRT